MEKEKVFLVAGGDMRQLYGANKLRSKYNKVYCIGFDKCYRTESFDRLIFISDLTDMPCLADYLLLPPVILGETGNLNTPLSENELIITDIISAVKPMGTAFGGRFSEKIQGILKKKGIRPVDYLQNEVFNIRNAVPTAEGALKIAIEQTDRTIRDSDVVIVGFGRIGKVLVKMFSDLGANVTLAARSETDREYAALLGSKQAVPVTDICEYIKGNVVVLNTVPSICIDENALQNADSRCIIVDLASRPGGVDIAYAQEKGVRVIQAPGLPGKLSPVTAGEIIAETIAELLRSKGEGIE